MKHIERAELSELLDALQFHTLWKERATAEPERLRHESEIQVARDAIVSRFEKGGRK